MKLMEQNTFSTEELMDYLSGEKLDVVATFGAGNIDRYIEPITGLAKSRLQDPALTGGSNV